MGRTPSPCRWPVGPRPPYPRRSRARLPETAVLEPVVEDPGGPRCVPAAVRTETTVIPVPRHGSGPETEPTPPVAGPTPRPGPPDQQRRSQRKPGRHRPRHTLADDIFELGDDDE